jgi:integrase
MAVTVADLEALLASAKPAVDTSLTELVLDCIAHYRMNGKERYAKSIESIWKNHLSRYWSIYNASDITTSRMREYQQKRLLSGAARATVNREMAAISKALHLGYDHEPRKIAAIPKLIFFSEAGNARKVFVTAEQLANIREQAEKHAWPWFRVLIELAYWLGWRQGELLGLRAHNVDLGEKCIRLDKTKNGDPREVPLTAALITLVRPLVEGRPPDTRLFPISASGLFRMFNDIVQRAGCPEIHFHDFRRTSARVKRAAGIPTSVIMDIQGWKTEAMFRRYAIVSREDKLAALKKLERMK